MDTLSRTTEAKLGVGEHTLMDPLLQDLCMVLLIVNIHGMFHRGGLQPYSIIHCTLYHKGVGNGGGG